MQEKQLVSAASSDFGHSVSSMSGQRKYTGRWVQVSVTGAAGIVVGHTEFAGTCSAGHRELEDIGSVVRIAESGYRTALTDSGFAEHFGRKRWRDMQIVVIAGAADGRAVACLH